MDLKWWPVVLVGSICFVAVVALAARLSMNAARRQLRPLANVERLTQLPEYAKAARLRSLSAVVTLVVLTVMFGAAIWAGARPMTASADFDATHPEDIMLCVAQPVTDAATAELLNYFARRATTFPEARRIGLTSVNRRLVPLTRDHDYAATQFGDYADTGQAQSATFAPVVPYTDYAGSVDDVLALCLSGFADTEDQDTHRRSVIYLGPGELRAGGERRAALFTDRSLRDLNKRIGAQINVVDTRSPVAGALVVLAEQTGGQYVAPGAMSITAALDKIRAHTPPARRADGTLVTVAYQDAPALPLALALLSAAVLSVALLVLRR